MAEKTLILVIGCHRSGTSAVAGCLAQMGVVFGDGLLGPAFDNPKGFFEQREVIAIHDRLLAEKGGSWDQPREVISGEVTACKGMTEILDALPGPVCAVKDPRASLFVDIWAKACQIASVRLCVLEVRRDRDAVAASLMQREGWDEKRARKLVVGYTEAIERAGAVHSIPWQLITFPNDLTSEDAWRKIFAGFSLDVEVDMEIIGAYFDPRLIHHGADTPPLWSVIIPSRDDEKVLDCVASLVEAHPEIEANQIVIVSDGLSWRTRLELRDCTWVQGKRPFVFARAINQGAAAMDPASDIVILGDDVRIETPRALGRLAAASAGAAAVAPEVVGVCGQAAQRAGSGSAEAHWLAFICAYIPRNAWNAVGQLDERFTGYGYDDVDWCHRARSHGLMKVIHDVRVIHTQDSSYRSQPGWEDRYAENGVRFEEKWNALEVA